MRTTINLPDALAEEAKRRAKETGCTFTSLLVDGLRRVLSDRDTNVGPIDLPAFGDPSLDPLVDVTDREALSAVLDADGPR